MADGSWFDGRALLLVVCIILILGWGVGGWLTDRRRK